MGKGNVVSLEDRIPKLKEQRKRKTNRRLIFLLSVFFLLIICVIYFQSPLSHVGKISIKGNFSVSKKLIIEKSGLTSKTNIWNMKNQEIEKKILQLPEIKSVGIKKVLPNKVDIEIKEHKQIASFANGTGFTPVLENGVILSNNSLKEFNGPILTNFHKGKYLKLMAEQLQQLPAEITNSISEIHYDPNKTDSYHILLYMNDGYEVSATMRTLADKMVHYPSIISQLTPNVKGIIDLEVGSYFTPFKSKGDQNDEKQGSEG
ncbi:cell division protein FtsQ [Heyndrickxia shackletonii]|uniref:Cell division protein DivIB n=1 Tax=Heyndrickxia shackletonii TaxID=157838 RepID=A0A0Q3WZ76_9BACI|nr:cell division protein FtsQ/DivIB [Heyndrickxia shackletonii]KQL54717.1 cell division protein FtsQ [Heyndrickxia shackletonii]NEY98370.1 cell division protein FtsQ/DivIB [Heyndrickxia shackletonii]